jgi:hypothetical protein
MNAVIMWPAILLPMLALVVITVGGFLCLAINPALGRKLVIPLLVLIAVLVFIGWLMGGLHPPMDIP